MNIVESYLEKGWGDSVDNPSLEDVETAIKETQQMDDEHGAFWIGVYSSDDKEIILEVNKNLRLTLILNSENLDSETLSQKTSQAGSWVEILEKFKLFINGQVDKVEESMI